MPILTSDFGPHWMDPDTVPRPLVVFGAARAGENKFEIVQHRHAKGQLLLVQRAHAAAADPSRDRDELRPMATATRGGARREVARGRLVDPVRLVTMFKKALGTSPARYMAERHAQSSTSASSG